MTTCVLSYIKSPLLLKGKKFDVRSYLLIACTSPFMVFFRHGYVRLTCDFYDPSSSNLSTHLTNQVNNLTVIQAWLGGLDEETGIASWKTELWIWDVSQIHFLMKNNKFFISKQLHNINFIKILINTFVCVCVCLEKNASNFNMLKD